MCSKLMIMNAYVVCANVMCVYVMCAYVIMFLTHFKWLMGVLCLSCVFLILKVAIAIS